MNLLYRDRVARAVTVIAGAYLLYYLWWRASATLNPEAPGFSWIVLAAEVQGAFNFYLFAMMAWDIRRVPPCVLRPGLTVDVFVPTYNEELDILEATLTGCRMIRYPHTTYVLDDGRRPEVAALAERLGCRYLTRPDNAHAKAGNLNAALRNSDGAFIVVLDADIVPQPDYLDRTLGYFVDERVALVQLPQEFYNRDSVQHARSAEQAAPWHDQTLFYRVIQPGKNRWNAAFWCGSPSVVRRAALEDVGGVATETITEDIHTTVRLHARGWKTVYHDEILAYGIAPQTLYAFALQRLRWAQGTMQLLRSRENPIIMPGLSLGQRLNYVASTFTYFDAYQKLIYITTPSVILLTGLLPLRIEGWQFFLHWVPYFLLGLTANTALGRGSFRYLQVEQYNLLKMFTFIWASTILVWPRPLRFKVTPKKTDDTVGYQERQALRPNMVVLALILATMAIGMLNLLTGLTASYSSDGIIVMTFFWALANAGLLAIGVNAILRRIAHLRRRTYRFPARLKAAISDLDGVSTLAVTENLSREGVGILTSANLPGGRVVRVSLKLPEGHAAIYSQVMANQDLGDGSRRLGLRFLEMGDEARARLVGFLFVTLPRQAAAGAPADDLIEFAALPDPRPAAREPLTSLDEARAHLEAALADLRARAARWEHAPATAWDGAERRSPTSPLRQIAAPAPRRRHDAA